MYWIKLTGIGDGILHKKTEEYVNLEYVSRMTRYEGLTSKHIQLTAGSDPYTVITMKDGGGSVAVRETPEEINALWKQLLDSLMSQLADKDFEIPLEDDDGA